jgi:ribose transport system ATP-binding protein
MEITNIIEARNIEKRFGGVLALDRAEFICPKGQIVGLLGENGSGKSTLSRILTGNMPATSGEILYKGELVQFNSPHEAEEQGMAMVYQNYSLVPDLTVWQNIYLGKETLKKNRMMDDQKIKELASHHLDMLCPWVNPNTIVRRLSSSDRQLVEITKALASEPEFLILDEPTSALESGQVERLFSLMAELKAKDVSMVYISHRMHEIEEICDCAIVLRNGQTAGTVDLSVKEKVNDEEIVQLITGKKTVEEGKRDNKKSVSEETTLKVENVNVEIQLNDISLELKKGEIVGVAGLQGQGQTELMLTLAGYKRINSGAIKMGGKTLNIKHPKNAINEGIVLVPGDRVIQGLCMGHSIFSNMTLPLSVGKKAPWVLPMKSLREISKNLVHELSLKAESLRTAVSFLSGGNAQKVVIAKWLPLKPKVLLLSDPAKGIDVQTKADLYSLVNKVAEEGTSVLVYASDLKELLKVCDRILVMFEGNIVDCMVNKDLDEGVLMERCLRSYSDTQ